MTAVAGLLLSGGASRRMGCDKASIRVDGQSAASRAAARLSSVADPVWEVGPSHCHLPHVVEDPPGSGPVGAVVAGWKALTASGFRGPVLVLACDLPLMTAELLRWLAEVPGPGTVIPRVEGRAQPLCARWSAPDLDRVVEYFAGGYRAFKTMYDELDIGFLDERAWSPAASSRAFSDTDAPGDFDRLGIVWEPALAGPR
ncbi:MAG TPA: molybdenum cofactor guanylyltransferase [Acidimicrobiales bacterium]|jgi:molybdopterin-guanine dinucleotide biosynthesis protein A|nr:molybdenum cofactor guanylyltransferase [Acidimicrobiales bacterium]